MNEILVIAEHRDGQLRDITFEMLTMAKKLASDNNLSVTALFLGYNESDLSKQLENACDKLFLMEDLELANYCPESYLMAIQTIIIKNKPLLTLMGHTSAGMDLAPFAASSLSIPLVTDCVKAGFEDGTLWILRDIYGGKINARLEMKPSDQYMITVRSGSFSAETDHGKSCVTESISPPDWADIKKRLFLGYFEADIEDVDIAAADILVSIGRGIGKPENIPIAQDFADSIGATLSCSRPVADEGWLPKSRQVGTSGKTVKPKIYLALGISGAYQHQVGIKNSDTIIAVNTDPKAPIFNIAHYGIVEDMLRVLPLLKDKFTKK